MKQSGIAYPAQKMFFYFLTLMTMKKRLDRINDLIDGEHSSSYFDISNLLTAAFLKISSMEQIFPYGHVISMSHLYLCLRFYFGDNF